MGYCSKIEVNVKEGHIALKTLEIYRTEFIKNLLNINEHATKPLSTFSIVGNTPLHHIHKHTYLYSLHNIHCTCFCAVGLY